MSDEDVAGDIHLHLQSLGNWVTAKDIVRYVATPEFQARLNVKRKITIRTAQRWMKKMGYRWKREPKGMYSDGHERADVVHYRQNVFLPRWRGFEARSRWYRDGLTDEQVDFDARMRVVTTRTDHSLTRRPSYFATWVQVFLVLLRIALHANHIFNRRNITSHHEYYIFISGVEYQLKVSEARHNIPLGFLFLCPFTEPQSDVAPSSRVPDCPAYWSLDPSGVERLSTDKADDLGFPAFKVEIKVDGHSWDASVYAGLRQFHQGKHFDPASQDVARHLRYPLYQLSDELGVPFAREGPSAEDNVCESDPALADDGGNASTTFATEESTFQDMTPKPFRLDDEPILLWRPWKVQSVRRDASSAAGTARDPPATAYS
ncbi:hypothetical protein B0H14DRAFT_3582507 [Mycena olivaceomarginata]|nr:hypothetical protein B0H14DRAFT_3582507 [Mycena olivaceomarginata]